MKKILSILLLLPALTYADDSELFCKGEEIKYNEGDIGSQRAVTKVIGIQIYREGMRLDGEWFDSKSDVTEDYLLERSYLNTKDSISGTRNFSTNSLIEGRKIKTVKVDDVEINMLTNEIYWVHKFSRLDITDAEANVIYNFRKDFKGACK